MSLLDLTLMEKQVVGSLFGSGNPRADIPKLLGLYRDGQLDLDGLVTKTYTLDQVNDGYDDIRAGQEHPRRHGLRLRRSLRRSGTRRNASPTGPVRDRTVTPGA